MMFRIRDAEESLVVLMLFVLVVLVFIAACLRWFGVSVAWSIEIAQLLFVWVCFIGADIALRTKGHIGVDLLRRYLPDRVEQWVQIVCAILMIAFLVFVFYFGTILAFRNWNRRFNTIQISYSFVTLSAPVGSFLMILTLLGRLKQLVTEGFSKRSSVINQQGSAL